MQITTSFPTSLEKAIKKSYDQFSDLAIKQSFFSKWMRIAPTTEYNQTFTSDEGIDDWASLEESGALKDLNRAEGFKVAISSAEYAGKLTVTKKMRIRAKDNTTLLGQFLAKDMKKLIIGGKRHMEYRAHAVLNNGFVTDGSADAGHGVVLAPDTKALFSASHTWNSSDNTWSNLGTAAFSIAAWDMAKETMSKFVSADGAPDPKMLDTIIVRTDTDAARSVKRMLYGTSAPITNDVSDSGTEINLYQGNKDGIKLIETPYIKSDTAWFARDSKELNPLFMHQVQSPTMEEKQIRENLDWVYPATSSYEVGCDNAPTSWYGSQGLA